MSILGADSGATHRIYIATQYLITYWLKFTIILGRYSHVKHTVTRISAVADKPRDGVIDQPNEVLLVTQSWHDPNSVRVR